MSNRISLSEAVTRAKNTENSVLDKIKNPEEIYFQLGFLEHPNIVFACNSLVSNQYEEAKNYFFKIATISVSLNKMFNAGMFSSTRIFCYPVLCDSHKILKTFLEFDENFLKTFGVAFAKAVQACIKNDDSALSHQIELLAKYTNKKTWEKNFSGCVDAFRGILQNDKMLVEKGINDLLSKHEKQDHPAVVRDFINLEATTIAKLAYRRGINVQIDSLLVPKELIPTKELDHYESYDFLAPLS